MNPDICTFLRHQTKVRHVGDLVAIWCDCCGLYVPPEPTSHPDFSQGAGREASPRSSSRALRGAALATQPA
ncbi:MAG: hypothetical protein AB1627_01160 [Chloroflexota bacterium]